MDEFIKNLELIGLRKREIKVLTTLHIFGPLSITQLGAKSNLSRTTVDAIVRRLHERSFVRRVPKGKRHVWKATDVLKVKNRTGAAFEAIQSQIDPSFIGPVLEQIDAKDVGIRVYRGKKQVQAAYIEFFKKYPNRMLGVQGRGFIEKYGSEVFDAGAELLMKKEIIAGGTIVEGVMAESNVASMRRFGFDPDYLEQVFQIPYAFYTVPDELVDYPLEFVISGGRVAVSIPGKQLFITIDQPEIVSIFRVYVEVLKARATKLNTQDLKQMLLESGRE